ncbi:MAG: hypothetical protein KKB66_18455 [Alphaproteobacteria bacterium]|nr:hypothetical protein [Alphaproteobacteria bacterium]MBU0803586.1 hypothetical protein [Alphaproteobacteria bacterium]MBU0873117.1 hypothetical protein [Alphaproteobacteria bacterium]MBU1402513.1 hypothetical protein [Alphaproteobacteria bacterium]MBU1593155.1 hypothetical protein [Alphaproteobacteria bacterium]
MSGMNKLPPPPPGFVVEGAGEAMPAPPPGFELVEAGIGNRDNLMGKLDTVARGAADLASFGLADEIAAGGDALFNPIFGTGNPGGSIGERYGRNLADQRATDSADEQDRFGYRLGGQIAGGVGGGVAAAKGGLSLAANAAQSGKGWFARMLGGAADGGIAAGLYGAGGGDGPSDRVRKALDSIPLGMAFGTAGEGIATGAGNLFRRVAQGASDVAPGVNPSANVSDAEQFGIPLSRAQATRSVPQANIENQLRSQGVLTEFDQTQRGAIGQSIGSVQSQLAGQAPVIAGQASAYDNIPAALRGKRDALKAASQDAYEGSVNNPDVLVSGRAVQAIPGFIRGRLNADQILIDPMYHQGAARAMSFVDNYIARMPKPGGDVSSVQAQLRWVENLRAGLRKNFPPIGQDAPALKAISAAIDDWTDEVFDRGLVNASDDVLTELKTARAKWSEYKGMAEPRSKHGRKLNPQYEAQARIRNIMDKDFSPEEIGQYLWGTSVASPKNAAFMTAQELRRHLGPDSTEWGGIRQSFWLRATRAGDEVLSPVQIAKNLEGLLNGNGKGVAQTLYSGTELELMRKYASVMRNLSPAREGFNNSNTANRLMPALQRYGMAIVSALAGGGSLYSGLEPLSALGVTAATGGLLKGAGSLATSSRAAAATRMPVPINPTGSGGATLRGGSIPLVIGQEKRRPLEITVGRPGG